MINENATCPGSRPGLARPLAAGRLSAAGRWREASPAPTTPPPELATAATTDAPRPTEPAAQAEEEYRIVTLLPPDGIQAIDDPEFYDAMTADLEYGPDELVMGVAVGEDARAYPIDVLARQEIVNDEVGGQPIAVTY